MQAHSSQRRNQIVGHRYIIIPYNTHILRNPESLFTDCPITAHGQRVVICKYCCRFLLLFQDLPAQHITVFRRETSHPHKRRREFTDSLHIFFVSYHSFIMHFIAILVDFIATNKCYLFMSQSCQIIHHRFHRTVQIVDYAIKLISFWHSIQKYCRLFEGFYLPYHALTERSKAQKAIESSKILQLLQILDLTAFHIFCL